MSTRNKIFIDIWRRLTYHKKKPGISVQEGMRKGYQECWAAAFYSIIQMQTSTRNKQTAWNSLRGMHWILTVCIISTGRRALVLVYTAYAKKRTRPLSRVRIGVDTVYPTYIFKCTVGMRRPKSAHDTCTVCRTCTTSLILLIVYCVDQRDCSTLNQKNG